MALTADLVARCERPEPDPGPEPGYRPFTNEECEAAAKALLAQNASDTLWVFAYGSLIWKPAFAHIEHRRATAHGWHRSFYLELKSWRGSPQQPGLMMGLQRGGRCEGIAYRLPDADLIGQVSRLLRREVGGGDEMIGVRWINVETDQGKLRALAFWAGATGRDYIVRHPLAQVAHILARACGHIGSGAAYLYNTVVKLEELGIRDRNLWRLQQLVADEIVRINPAASAAAPQSLAGEVVLDV